MSSMRLTEVIQRLVADPVHQRGQRLSYNEWSAVIWVPRVCDVLGEEWPEWAWELCELASTLEKASPPALLDALLLADREQAGAPCDRYAAQLGADLGLCVVTPSSGPDAWLVITPFGHAVAMLHDLHLNALAQAADE